MNGKILIARSWKYLRYLNLATFKNFKKSSLIPKKIGGEAHFFTPTLTGQGLPQQSVAPVNGYKRSRKIRVSNGNYHNRTSLVPAVRVLYIYYSYANTSFTLTRVCYRNGYNFDGTDVVSRIQNRFVVVVRPSTEEPTLGRRDPCHGTVFETYVPTSNPNCGHGYTNV